MVQQVEELEIATMNPGPDIASMDPQVEDAHTVLMVQQVEELEIVSTKDEHWDPLKTAFRKDKLSKVRYPGVVEDYLHSWGLPRIRK
jgi:hypothetical protein